jgi:large subunit ribosomal protein L25
MKVEAISRSVQGTGASRRLRREGKVPAIVYGGNAQPVNIELDHNSIFHAMRKEAFHSSVLELTVDGKAAGQVLLRDYQMHAFKPIVMHVDFQRIDANQKLHKKVPLHFNGQESSPAVKQSGAIVSHIMTEIDIKCLPKDLPEFIEVDLSGLKVGETLHISQLQLPAGVEAVHHGSEDPAVATAVLPRGAKEEEAPAAAPAAVPATAQKADKK